MSGCEHLIKYIFIAKFARENSQSQSTNAAIANDFRRVVHGDCKLTKSEKGEYIQKLHTNVSTFVTSPLHRIFLTLLHVLLGLKSYAHMSDFKIKEVCGTRHEFRHHFITSILKWQNFGLQIQDVLVCKNAFLIQQ